ncbi:MAG: DUF4129 domain-containing protein [Clostridia bacterium]|nr:DUF4129 domain-containing protein [Clostridia bacterium]
MKEKIFGTLNSFITFLPLYIFASLVLLPVGSEVLWFVPLIFVMTALGTLFGWLFRKNVFFAPFFGVIFVIAITVLLLFGGRNDGLLDQLRHMACGVLSFIPFLMGKNVGAKNWYEVLQPAMSLVMLFLHAVILIFVVAMGAFGEFQKLYVASVILFALFQFYSMNRNNLLTQLNRNTRFKNKKIREAEAHRGKEAKIPVSPSLRRDNWSIVLVLMLVTALLVPVVGGTLSFLGEGLVDRLNDRGEPEYEKIEVELSGETAKLEEEFQKTEGNKVMPDVVLVTLCLLFALLIYFLLRRFWSYIKKLLKDGNKDRYHTRKKKVKEEKEEELYEEVVETINFNWLNGKKLRDLVRERIGWLAMRTEEERVRYLFRHTVRKAGTKGYKHRLSKTAFETLGEIAYADGNPTHERALRNLADAYNTTRYDGAPPPDGTAAAIREALK